MGAENEEEEAPEEDACVASHGWKIMDWLTERNKASEETHGLNCAKMLPHSSGGDVSWCDSWPGAFVYDTLATRELPEVVAKDFKSFAEQTEATLRPSCNKVDRSTAASFAQFFTSRDWTATDESMLRSGYWGCRQYELDSATLLKHLQESSKDKGQEILAAAGNLCSGRYQCVKPTFVQMGALASCILRHCFWWYMPR